MPRVHEIGPVRAEVGVISGVDLVGPLSVEHDGDAALSGQPHQLIPDERRRRVHGLVVVPHRPRQDVPELLRTGVQLVQDGAGPSDRLVDVLRLAELFGDVANAWSG